MSSQQIEWMLRNVLEKHGETGSKIFLREFLRVNRFTNFKQHGYYAKRGKDNFYHNIEIKNGYLSGQFSKITCDSEKKDFKYSLNKFRYFKMG